MGKYVKAKTLLKVLLGDKNKVNIQGSEKPVITKANIKSKQSHPFHIPYQIPFAPDEVEPNANEDHQTINSKDESSNSKDSDATSPYTLFPSSDLSDSEEKLKLMKKQSKLPTQLHNY